LRRYNLADEAAAGGPGRGIVSVLDAEATDGTPSAVLAGVRQGLTLVHFSAQRKRLLWERGCI